MTPHGAPPSETARDHLHTAVFTGRLEETAAAALGRLPAVDAAEASHLWVLDRLGRLVGIVPLARLVLAAADVPLHRLMQPPPPSVPPETDQESVADVALTARVDAVPVAAADGRFIGIVPPLAIIDVLHREHDEDMRRIVGISEQAGNATAALAMPPWRRVKGRLPWLLLGLVGSVLTALVMAGFERRLEETIAISFFVPAIVYLADAIGTQTEAVAVRGLSLKRLPLAGLLAGELATGALLGLLLGAVAFPVIMAFVGLRLAAAVAIAVVAAGTLASVIGLLFPWLLSRFGSDPAYGSGPIATIIQDVLSLLVYFAAVMIIV